MHVTYLGHASILAQGAGTKLLMDPWLVDPGYCGAWYHYPPLALKVPDLGAVDYVWCSHDHPDHFHRETLRQLPRDQKILVPQFASGRLERELREEGFEQLVPLPFDETVDLGGIKLTCLRTDLVWEDSALIVEADGATLFNMNDCKLGDDLLRSIGQRWSIDIAFLPFSGAIQFPTCYGYEPERLAELCAGRRGKHLDWFVHRAELLGCAQAVPFAGNFALLRPEQLWMNAVEANNINTPDEAIARLAAQAAQIEGVQMNPGDRWTKAGGLVRDQPAPDFAAKADDIAKLAPVGAELAAAFDRQLAPAADDLLQQVGAYFGEIATRYPQLPGRINARVVIETRGAPAGNIALDFSAAGLRCGPQGADDPWNLWLTVDAPLLQRVVDGKLLWDELVLSFRVDFRENPEFFNRDFWVMLYNSDPAFMEPYLADPAPSF